MLNNKARLVYLALVFGFMILLTSVARLFGNELFSNPDDLSRLVGGLVMFIPAPCAILVHRIFLKKSLKDLNIRFGSWAMYAKVYGLIILMTAIGYLITWVFFLKPDFTLQSFFLQTHSYGVHPSAISLIILSGATTFLIAPILNMISALGEEIGWRGYLLPSLLPQGQLRAVIFTGVIWALWHMPLIFILSTDSSSKKWLEAIILFISITSLGTWMGYIWLRTRSTTLSAFIHALVNANAGGFWALLFVGGNRFIVGPAGLIAMSMNIALALYAIYKIQKQQGRIMVIA